MLQKIILLLTVLASRAVQLEAFTTNLISPISSGTSRFQAEELCLSSSSATKPSGKSIMEKQYGFSLISTNYATSSTTLFMASPAVVEPPTKEKEKVEDKEKTTEKQNYSKKGGWAVRLFNDPMNKREFVAMCLSKIVGLSDGQAYQVMMQAHKNGVSVVGRFDFERAETYKTALVDNGLTCDMIEVED